MRQFLHPLVIFILTTLGVQLVFSGFVIFESYKEQKRRLRLYGEYDRNKIFESSFDLTIIMPYAVIFASWTAFYASYTAPGNILFGLVAILLTFLGLIRLR